MAAHPRSRVDIARRLAACLGTELHPELLELVPPVDWDELATRTDLRDELRTHHGQVDRRLTGIRDALAVAHHGDVRRLIGLQIVTLAAAAAALWAGRRMSRRSSGAVTDAGS